MLSSFLTVAMTLTLGQGSPAGMAPGGEMYGGPAYPFAPTRRVDVGYPASRYELAAPGADHSSYGNAFPSTQSELGTAQPFIGRDGVPNIATPAPVRRAPETAAIQRRLLMIQNTAYHAEVARLKAQGLEPPPMATANPDSERLPPPLTEDASGSYGAQAVQAAVPQLSNPASLSAFYAPGTQFESPAPRITRVDSVPAVPPDALSRRYPPAVSPVYNSADQSFGQIGPAGVSLIQLEELRQRVEYQGQQIRMLEQAMQSQYQYQYRASPVENIPPSYPPETTPRRGVFGAWWKR